MVLTLSDCFAVWARVRGLGWVVLAVVRDLRELRERALGDERALPVLENGAPRTCPAPR